MEVVVGSNTFRDTKAVLTVEGKDQIFLETGSESGQLLLTADIYDRDQTHVAKLRRNAWAFNQKDAYVVKSDPHDLQLIEKATGKILLRASVLGPERILISQGWLYTPSGSILEISPDYVRLLQPVVTMSGNVISNCGGGIRIS